MTFKRETVGTGITQKTRTRLRIESPDDMRRVAVHINAADDRIHQITAHCERTLAALGLPTDPLVYDERPPLSPQSPEWYAVEVLDHLRLMQAFLDNGESRQAACCAIDAGMLFQEAAMKFKWEEHALLGVKTVQGGRKGHEQVHGTEVEKQARWDNLQSKLNEIMTRSPRISLTQARKEVAQELDVSFSTVRRHTRAPRK